MKNRIISVAALVFGLLSSAGWSQNYEAILPLVSTRLDVERQIGVRSDESDVLVTYFSKTAKFIARYSRGTCSESPLSDWNVPRDTLISLSVFPAKIKYVDTSVNLANYEKIAATAHLPGHFVYINDEAGRSVYVEAESGKSSRERIVSYTYFPRSNQDSLKCSK